MPERAVNKTQTRLIECVFLQDTSDLSRAASLFLRYIPPAEDTLVGTGEAGGSFHASVGLNTIESVLVTATSPSQHRLTNRNNTFNVIHAFSLSKCLKPYLEG